MKPPRLFNILSQSDAEAIAAQSESVGLGFLETPSNSNADGPTDDEDDAEVLRLLPRPTRRSQCEHGVRPCPWVSCRYNLYLDVRADGILRLNFPDREPDEMTASCALDLAGDGPRTLDQVATLMGMSRERARQLEDQAMSQIRRDFYSEDLLGDRLFDE
jgi:hypothetical protein